MEALPAHTIKVEETSEPTRNKSLFYLFHTHIGNFSLLAPQILQWLFLEKMHLQACLDGFLRVTGQS